MSLINEILQELCDNLDSGARFATVSSRYSLDESMAYKVQEQLVDKRVVNLGLAGFKAAATAAPSQQKFGVDHPLAGVLHSSGRLESGAVLLKRDYHSLLLEAELVYVADKDILEPVQTVEQLKEFFSYVMPGIELPNIRFVEGSTINAVDVVATAALTEAFICGGKVPVANLDTDSLGVKFYKDGVKVSDGFGRDSLGSQWDTLLWLVNTSLSTGYKVRAGHVFFTGALGKVLPPEVGQYRAEFDGVGVVEFTLK